MSRDFLQSALELLIGTGHDVSSNDRRQRIPRRPPAFYAARAELADRGTFALSSAGGVAVPPLTEDEVAEIRRRLDSGIRGGPVLLKRDRATPRRLGTADRMMRALVGWRSRSVKAPHRRRRPTARATLELTPSSAARLGSRR
jgi:hypothetical protein